MRFDKGWLKIERALLLKTPPKLFLEGPDAHLRLAVFMYVLSCACIYDTDECNRGDALVGVKELAKMFGVTNRRMRNAFVHLESQDLLSFCPSRSGTCVTLHNFDRYHTFFSTDSTHTGEQPILEN